MLQKLEIFPAKQLAISKQVTPLIAVDPRGGRGRMSLRCCKISRGAILAHDDVGEGPAEAEGVPARRGRREGGQADAGLAGDPGPEGVGDEEAVEAVEDAGEGDGLAPEGGGEGVAENITQVKRV